MPWLCMTFFTFLTRPFHTVPSSMATCTEHTTVPSVSCHTWRSWTDSMPGSVRRSSLRVPSATSLHTHHDSQ